MKKRLLLTFAVLLSFGMFFFSRAYAELSPHEDAPDFVLTTTEGKEIDLKNLLKDKKIVLLNFWATWCPACKHEIPQLIALQKKYLNNAFSVVGIDVGESEKKATSFKQRNSINYPVVIDAHSEVAKKYAIVGLPVSVLIDSNGKVLGEYHEYSDQLETAVEKALK